jgi:hypothetical protein
LAACFWKQSGLGDIPAEAERWNPAPAKQGLKEIMAVTVAANGTERLEGYEIVVRPEKGRRDHYRAGRQGSKVPAKNGNTRRRNWRRAWLS